MTGRYAALVVLGLLATRSIDVPVSRVCRKLGDDANHSRVIGTVRGIGDSVTGVEASC
jgi:DNA-binding response OmpR family regulator